MKKAIFLGILGMVLPMISYAQEEKIEEPQKIYILPSEITFVDQGILAFVKDQWVPVTAVYADAFGIYVIGVANYPYTRWICKAPGCNFNNNGDDTTCRRWDLGKQKYCGASRPPG